MAPLKAFENIFSTEEERREERLEHIEVLPADALSPFQNHPFHVEEDAALLELTESIRQNGVMTPLLARPRAEGGYELISGHRRKLAAELAGIATLPVLVREMDDDTATVIMVDSNQQRENLLPSEKAFAYKMKLEAIKHQGKTYGQVGHKSREQLSEDESGRTIQRYIRLTRLIPGLLKLVDCGRVAFGPAVELSYLQAELQQCLLDTMECQQCAPSLSQAARMKKLCDEEKLGLNTIAQILGEEKVNQREKLSFSVERVRGFFPRGYTAAQMERAILALLEERQKKMQRKTPER